jgi:hypothetical protein
MTKTRDIRCACGSIVRCRPNRNGVVLCSNCRNAYTPEQFVVDDGTRTEVIHDLNSGKTYTRRIRNYPY